MSRWITQIAQANVNNAAVKPKDDLGFFANEMGYKDLNIFRYDPTGESEDAMRTRIDGITAAVQSGDLLVYQYPAYISNRFETKFVNMMRARDVKFVPFVHDVESIRFGPRPGFDEITYFNTCTALIVANETIKKQLTEMGVTVPMVPHYLWDYRTTQPVKTGAVDRSVVLAGSLVKSHVPNLWNNQTKLTVFGTFKADREQPFYETVSYEGDLPASELDARLPNSFGLAWDTESGYADYTRFNNPYKVSMYLSLGMPVVVWGKSAIAKFVLDNGLGLTVDSLEEIDAKLNELTADQILTMRENVVKLVPLIRNGYFARRSLVEIEKVVNDLYLKL